MRPDEIAQRNARIVSEDGRMSVERAIRLLNSNDAVVKRQVEGILANRDSRQEFEEAMTRHRDRLRSHGQQ